MPAITCPRSVACCVQGTSESRAGGTPVPARIRRKTIPWAPDRSGSIPVCANHSLTSGHPLPSRRRSCEELGAAMRVAEARQIAQDWVQREASGLPGFQGAYIAGSANWLSDDAEL